MSMKGHLIFTLIEDIYLFSRRIIAFGNYIGGEGGGHQKIRLGSRKVITDKIGHELNYRAGGSERVLHVRIEKSQDR